MVTIRLFCAAGMSTSLLVNKMKDAASKRGIEADIAAFPEGQMDQHLNGVNVALLGPQVGYTCQRQSKYVNLKIFQLKLFQW